MSNLSGSKWGTSSYFRKVMPTCCRVRQECAHSRTSRCTRGRNALSCHSPSPWETPGPLRLTWFADFLAVTHVHSIRCWERCRGCCIYGKVLTLKPDGSPISSVRRSKNRKTSAPAEKAYFRV